MINPFPNKPWFLCVCSQSLLKRLWEKEKLLVTSNFSFSHSVSYLFEELSAIFINFEIVVCKLYQFGKNLKLVVWERVKHFPVFLRLNSNTNFINVVSDLSSDNLAVTTVVMFDLQTIHADRKFNSTVPSLMPILFFNHLKMCYETPTRRTFLIKKFMVTLANAVWQIGPNTIM